MDENGDETPAEGAGAAGDDDDIVDMYGSPGGGTAPGTTGDESGSSDADADDGDDEPSGGSNLGAPLLGDDEGEEMEEVTGRFYVKHTEDVAVTLHEIDSEQIYTLIENPGLETHQILDATIAENPPLGVSYVLEEIHSEETIPVEYSDEPPTRQVQQIVTDMEHGQAVAIEREGEGEIHVLYVDPDDTAEAAAEIDDDETTYKNAARYGVGRVEVRTDGEEGIVSVRYLP